MGDTEKVSTTSSLWPAGSDGVTTLLALNASPAGVFDSDGVPLACNDSLDLLLKEATQDDSVVDLFNLVESPNRSVLKSLWRELRPGQTAQVDVLVCRAEGQTEPALCRVQCVPGDQPLFAVALTLNPERPLREQTDVDQHRQWLESVLDLLPIGLMFVNLRTGEIEYVNRSVHTMAGGRFPYLPSELARPTGYWLSEVDGPEIPFEKTPIARLMAGERSRGVEMDWHTPSRVVPIMVWSELLPAMHGREPIGVVIFEDITALRSARKVAKESETRYRALFEANLMGVVVGNVDGAVYDANAAFLEIVGYDREDVTSGRLNWKAITPPEFVDADAVGASELASGRVPRPFEKEFIRKDGSRTPVFVGAVPLPNPGEALGIVLNLTELRQAEMALRKASERFELAVRGSEDGIWDWDVDSDVVYFSPQWKRQIGYEDHELPNRFDEWTKRLHPEDRPAMLKAVEDYLERRIPHYEVEFRFQHKDGSYRWILARGQAVRRPDGRPYRFSGSHTDITHRKAQQQKLEELLANEQRRVRTIKGLATASLAITSAYTGPQRLETIARQARDILSADQAAVMVSKDQDWAHATTSEAFAQRNDRKRRPTHAGVPEDLLSLVCQNNRPVRITGREMKSHPEWSAIAADGHGGWLAAPLVGRDGRNLGLVYVSGRADGDFTEEDLTVLVQLAQVASVAIENSDLISSVEELNARLQHAMQETHHRVKNNLQVIAAMVDMQLLNDQASYTADDFRRVSLHVRALATVHDLITNALKHGLTEDLISASTTLSKMLVFWQQLAPQNGLIADLEEADVTPRQGSSLAIAVNELISNALKHGRPPVHVTLKVDNGVVAVSVRDAGPGFPNDLLDDRNLSSGLDLVRQVCRWDLAGELRFTNLEGGGAEATITFTLPPAGEMK